MRRSQLRRQSSIVAAICCIALSISVVQVFADDPPPTPEDLERLAAIEAFTARQKAANYPEKFKKAAEEFGIPVEILMVISFAETRHEHLMWPEGETVSPENGMPRPYGIMSLWDNDLFGHSLIEAAKLIGQDPEVLKKDAYQNMRGGAALLKKLYETTPKNTNVPTADDRLESWYAALAAYSGIPEPDLSHSHSWDCFDFLSQGYDQYGITLPEVPGLDLQSLYAETKRIREEQRKINEEKWRAEGRMDDAILEEIVGEDGMTYAREVNTNAPTAAGKSETPKKAQTEPAPVMAATPVNNQNWMLGIGAIVLCAAALALLIFRKKNNNVG